MKEGGKFTLTLNSHELSDFQNCEMQYALGDLICLQRSGPIKEHFTKGLEIGKILEIYYYRKMKGRSAKALGRIDLLYKRFCAAGIEPKEASGMITSLVEYFRTYAQEEIEPIAVEKGFSKILYEDNENLFIYEGRPDLVAKVNGEPTVIDHKTQGQRRNYFFFNNQARGYCWGTGIMKFMYNYLVFVKTDCVRRGNYTFVQNDIDTWIADTTKWYFRVKRCIQDKDFLRSWNCESKYGLCDFTGICTASNDAMRSWIIKRDFEIRDRRQSW